MLDTQDTVLDTQDTVLDMCAHLKGSLITDLLYYNHFLILCNTYATPNVLYYIFYMYVDPAVIKLLIAKISQIQWLRIF
jgi:hypothetical protein